MAMVRAARTGGPLRSCPFSISSCLRSSRYSTSAAVIFTEHDTDKAGHFKEFGVEPWAQNTRNELLGSFLKEQRRFLNEFLCHLKDQRVLLDSIGEELGLQKTTSRKSINDIVSLSEDLSLILSECNTRKEVAMEAVSTPSCMNAEIITAEQPEKDVEQVSSVVFESTSGNDLPIPSSEEKGMSGAPLARKESDTNSFQHPSWSEWATFLNNLRPYTSMEKEPKEDFELFEDTTILKRAIVKFAQAHEDTFRSLSQKDLRMLVQHEFPSMDEKTAGGKKKLQDYLKSDKNRANRFWSNKVFQAKLTDVVRLVYRAIRSMPALGGALPSDLNSAVIHILQDLNSASIAQHNSAISKVGNVPAAMSQPPQEVSQKIELAKVNEVGLPGDISRTVHGEASPPHERNGSIEQKDSTSKSRMALSSLDVSKYGSLKERVDARRERLARESFEKEAAKDQLLEPLLTKEPNFSAVKKSSIEVEKSKVDCVVARNFEAFDAIIESDDYESSNVHNKAIVTHGREHEKTEGKRQLEEHFRSKSKPLLDKVCTEDSVSSGESEIDFDEDDLEDSRMSFK